MLCLFGGGVANSYILCCATNGDSFLKIGAEKKKIVVNGYQATNEHYSNDATERNDNSETGVLQEHKMSKNMAREYKGSDGVT